MDVRCDHGIHSSEGVMKCLKLSRQLLCLSSMEKPTVSFDLMCPVLFPLHRLREQGLYRNLQLASILHERLHQRIAVVAKQRRRLSARIWKHHLQEAFHPRCLLAQYTNGVRSGLDCLDCIADFVSGVKRGAQDAYHVGHWEWRRLVVVWGRKS